MKSINYICTLSFLMFSFSSFGIDITVNSISINPNSNCTSNINVNFDLSYDNIVDDGFVDPLFGDFSGSDIFDVVIRDGGCNIISHSYVRVDTGFTGNGIFTVPGTFDNISTFAPESGPFTVSFHETDNFNTSATAHLTSAPLATYDLDPSNFMYMGGSCGTLPTVATPNCSFFTPTTTAAIPTLSQWGLILLSLLMMIFAMVAQYKLKVVQ